MPNWVYNNIGGFTPEMHERYSGEDTDIDFNKIIPMPEELNLPECQPLHSNSKNVYEYETYKENTTNKGFYNAPHEFRDSLDNYYRRNIEEFGKKAVSNPDKPLNELLDTPLDKKNFEDFTNIYGDVYKSNHDVGLERLDKYSEYLQNQYLEIDDTVNDSRKEIKEKFPTLLELGKFYKDCEDKYGFDNWYDWRNANWGTKWNASDTNYDGENQVSFSTAWSIPRPIIAKIAQDFPDAKLDGVSEEETGWFEEYNSKDGKIATTKAGEYQYDEDTDEEVEVLDETLPYNGEYKSYDEISQDSIRDWHRICKHTKFNF